MSGARDAARTVADVAAEDGFEPVAIIVLTVSTWSLLPSAFVISIVFLFTKEA